MLKRLLLCLLLLAPAWAGPSPVDAVEGFFSALHEQRYPDAWSWLDSGTQHYIAEEVATSYKLQKSDVLALFEANDPKVKWYWDAARKNLNTEQVYSKCQYWLLSEDGDSASVGCKYPGGDQQLELLAVRQGGSWRFDYFTTFVAE